MSEPADDDIALHSVPHPRNEEMVNRFAEQLQVALNPYPKSGMDFGPSIAVAKAMVNVIMDMIEWHWDRMNEEGELNEESLMETEIEVEGL